MATEPSESAGAHSLHAFGMILRSDLALDMLTHAPGATPDLEIVRHPGPDPLVATLTEPLIRIEPDRQILAWPIMGSFRIETPDRIDVRLQPGVGDDFAALPLLGPVMSILVERRGRLALHASAVEVGGRAALFLGDKGAGKSTTAAAFLAAGHRLIADDLAAIATDDAGRPVVLPAYGRTKIDRSAAEALALPQASLSALPHPDLVKLAFHTPTGFVREAVPVGLIYILGRHDGTGVIATRLGPAGSFEALLRFSSLARVGLTSLGPAHMSAHLGRCAALVRSTPVVRLQIGAGFGNLVDAVGVVRREIENADEG